MAKFFWLIAALAAVAAAEFVDSQDGEISEDMIRAMGDEVKVARADLSDLEESSIGDDISGKAGFKDKMTNKVKEMCKCDTHKDCACCFVKDIKVPIIGTYNLKICSAVAVIPEDKKFHVKFHIGSIKLFEKAVSYVKMEEVCKKFEKYKSLEFCMRMIVSESEEKGLSGCCTLQANIMDIFNKPIYLPCFHFKDNKMRIDDNMDEYKDDGVRLNLKNLWSKFKGLFSKKKDN